MKINYYLYIKMDKDWIKESYGILPPSSSKLYDNYLKTLANTNKDRYNEICEEYGISKTNVNK